MSNDLCSPYHCNVCLMLKNYDQNDSSVNLVFENLLTCSGCQLVKYCSKQHQKVDWPIHRQFCQAIQKIKQISNCSHPFYISGQPPRNKQEVEQTTLQLKYLLKNTLRRSLEHHEEELTSFPVYCAQCFKFKNLKANCSKCNSEFYCTEQHKMLHEEEHNKRCHLLKMYYCPYKVHPVADDMCKELYGRVEHLHKLDLVEAFQKVFKLKLHLEPYQNLASYQLFSYAADFSCILSICYAVNYLNLECVDSNKFNIIILGASVESVLWFRSVHCKIFFLQYSKVSELVLVFIGPEVVEPAYKELKFSFLGSERVVKFQIHKGLYQDYCEQIKPSLIVAFNCGFSEFSQTYKSSISTNLNISENLKSVDSEIEAKDTWLPGLVKVLQNFNTPIVLTSFTEQEAQFDYEFLQYAAKNSMLKVHIEQILKITKNRFRDLRPLRQWYTHDKEEFYYRNGYIQAVYTKLQQ